MEYKEILPAIFLSRANRFVANCLLDGKTVAAHVKNTGRCKELLSAGTRVYLERQTNISKRKTTFTLVHVLKGDRLINIDSQAPNLLVKEALLDKNLSRCKMGTPEIVRPEAVFDDVRFDFFLQKGSQRAYAEVKGVTLEENGWTFFPDAPTLRGVKHVRHLIQAAKENYLCYLIFVIQMADVKGFSPNWKMQPEFGEALLQAVEKGVEILAFSVDVTPKAMRLASPVPVDLLKGR